MMFAMLTLAVSLMVCALLKLYIQADQSIIIDSTRSIEDADLLPRIAIVGGGIGGASVAFKLHQLFSPAPSPEIDLFEAQAELGGRILSIPHPKDRRRVLELGALSFSDHDVCMRDTLRDIGLQATELNSWTNKFRIASGLWDGVSLRRAPRCDVLALEEQLGLFWMYGWSMWRVQNAVKQALTSWNKLPSSHGYTNISHEFGNQGIIGNILGTAIDYVQDLHLSLEVITDYVEACTRVGFWSNLKDSRALSSLISLDNVRPAFIQQGNSNIVNRLMRLSDAVLHLESRVTEITHGARKRYSIGWEQQRKQKLREYDYVIIAAPMHQTLIDFSNLSFGSQLVRMQNSGTLYRDLHVTYAGSSARLSPTYFNLPSNTTMPWNLMTTTSNSTDPDIFSITTTEREYRHPDEVCLWDDECDQFETEYIYRITSRFLLSDDSIKHMLGLSSVHGAGVPNKTTTIDDSCAIIEPTNSLDWIVRKSWPKSTSFYRYNETPLVDTSEIAPGLYYLSVAEHLSTSLEMSCRMGKNIALNLFYGHRLLDFEFPRKR